MQEMTIGDTRVRVINGMLKLGEIQAYLDHTYQKAKGRKLLSLDIVVDRESDEVELSSRWSPVPFERIRRITGYLTKLGKMNNAKRKETQDRVTHDLSTDADLADVLAEMEGK